jgi:hypothetical protein
MNAKQLAALTDVFNPQSYAEAAVHLARLAVVTLHGDKVWSNVVTAVDR